MEKLLEYITWENLRFVLWIVCGSGLFLEFSPIKINPLSSFLNWIGKKLNQEIKNEITKLDTKVDTVQSDLQDHKVESWRRDILNFADELMREKEVIKKTQENFDDIISTHDKYEKYIEERGLKNGKADMAIIFIKEKYKECLDNNSFYTGK